MRHRRILVDRLELQLPSFIEIEIQMPDFFYVAFGTTVGVFLEGIEAEIDVGAMRVLMAKPGLKFVARDLMGGGNPLYRLVSLPIPDHNGQPVLGLKVFLDVATVFGLGVHRMLIKGG